MCGCDLHWNGSGSCTCSCASHIRYRAKDAANQARANRAATDRPARTFTNPARTVVVTVHDAEGVAEIAYREGDSFGPPVELSEEI